MSDGKKLVQKFAERFNMEPEKMWQTLKATAFRQRDGSAPTNEQMAALLIVADQYGLNPFTKEVFAFQDRDGIIPVVSVDGWSRIINDHKAMDGLEFRWSDEMAEPEGGKRCPEWCEVAIYRKDRTHPIVVREYLDEVYRPPMRSRNGGNPISGPWQTHTKRFLRHKALIQGARVAFGFSGIYDQDEASRIIEGEAARSEAPALGHSGAALEHQAPSQATAGVAGLKAKLSERQAEPVAAGAESEPEPEAEPEAAEVDPEFLSEMDGAEEGGRA
ncbi:MULTISPECIES: phage recombination protein Bet [unclassified Thioalkalivibrio]|uniref:phage recombination protein Bet n=1 Tax=unclassified Thioalkalivibrio TaxID=2621013 RepID=UPI00037B0BF7|nr:MULTISPECIES: phage recombination protein Bet [unclassified Thioalkalivibrio]